MGERHYSTEPWVQEFPPWRNSHPLNLNNQIYTASLHTMTHKQRPSVLFHSFRLNSAKLCFVPLSKHDNVSFNPVSFFIILFALSGERYKTSVGRVSAECDSRNCDTVVYSWWGHQKLSLHGLDMLQPITQKNHMSKNPYLTQILMHLILLLCRKCTYTLFICTKIYIHFLNFQKNKEQ